VTPNQINRAIWSPLALRPIFVGADFHLRCAARHPPRIVEVLDSVWVAACPLNEPHCYIAGDAALFRLGVEADLPKEARRLQWQKVPSIARYLAKAEVLHLDPLAVAPSVDVCTARALGVDSWHSILVNGTPGLVGKRGEHAIAIIAPTETGKLKMLERLRDSLDEAIKEARKAVVL
jgi:hypothetical protein